MASPHLVGLVGYELHIRKIYGLSIQSAALIQPLDFGIAAAPFLSPLVFLCRAISENFTTNSPFTDELATPGTKHLDDKTNCNFGQQDVSVPPSCLEDGALEQLLKDRIFGRYISSLGCAAPDQVGRTSDEFTRTSA